MKRVDFVILCGENAIGVGSLGKVKNPGGRRPNAFRGQSWKPLVTQTNGVRAWHPELAAARNRSGVYVLRDRTTKRVLYVGESHTNRLYRTLLRHFQDPSGKFAALGEWVHKAPSRLQFLLALSSKEEAIALEKEAITYFNPAVNNLVVEPVPF